MRTRIYKLLGITTEHSTTDALRVKVSVEVRKHEEQVETKVDAFAVLVQDTINSLNSQASSELSKITPPTRPR